MSSTAIKYALRVGRWEPNARGRLLLAAMEDLYAERGFEQTTVAEIAERAGLSERTFFRHFADKREVLFSGAAELASAHGGGGRRGAEGVNPHGRRRRKKGGSW